MKYIELLNAFAKQPFFETADLVTLFTESEQSVLPRLSRWVTQGKVHQLRRGKYMLPELYQKAAPHSFYISNFLYTPSYISLFTALAYYKLIPEHTTLIQAVTTRATRHWETQYGRFHYHSIKTNRFLGYKVIELGNSSQQRGIIASPEKALIDICLLNSGEWTQKRWSSLRLQHIGILDTEILDGLANTISSKKLRRGIDALNRHLGETE